MKIKTIVLVFSLALICLAPISWAGYEDYGLKKVVRPEDDKAKKRNIAIWHFGASLIKVKPGGGFEAFNFSEESDSLEYALLSGDPSYSYALMPGKQYYIVDLGNTFMTEEFSIKSFTAEGSVRVAGSDIFHTPDSKKWKWIDDKVAFRRGDEVVINLGFLKARYILIEFDIRDPGNISNVSIIGPTKARAPDKQFTTDELPENTPIVPFNYAQTNEGATVEYVSSGDVSKVNNILDDSFEQPYEFDKKDNKAVMVLDLNKMRSINGLNMLMESDPGTFTFIFLDELPEELQDKKEKAEPEKKENLKEFGFLDLGRAYPLRLLAATEGSLGEVLTLGDIKGLKDKVDILKTVSRDAVALQKIVKPDEQQVQFDFANVNARYVIVVWTRDEAYAAQQGGALQPLRIYQVNVVGDVPEVELLTNPVMAFAFDNNEGDNINTLSTGESAFTDLGGGGNTVNDNTPTIPPIVPAVSPGTTVTP